MARTDLHESGHIETDFKVSPGKNLSLSFSRSPAFYFFYLILFRFFASPVCFISLLHHLNEKNMSLSLALLLAVGMSVGWKVGSQVHSNLMPDNRKIYFLSLLLFFFF